ncbi:hypothetical protein LIER_22209 [Lithospermum erythrorhizon]|uniref:Uncharacterized protein n=1 Tax=Lithospermum erythrorhizon TaxID=34254 RepID=A0AAV3QYQ9_LITER
MAERVTPSVRDTDVEDADGMNFYVPSATGTEDVTVGGKRKSKKRKHKKVVDIRSKPRRKLRKEERVAKRVRKAERRARRATQETAEEEADVPEDEVPPAMQPTASDEWLSEHEPRGEDVAQESDDEDVAAVMNRKRKAKDKLRMNENRTREEAKWRVVAKRRVTAEKMLSEVTKKNANIRRILEGAGVMPTAEIVGSYYPQLVREFVCNMAEDIDDPATPNFQKIIFHNFTFDFSPSIINGIQVALQFEDVSGTSGGENEETARFLRDEIRHLDGVIQTSLARKFVLEARLRSLSGVANPDVGGSGAETPQT